MSRKNQLLEMPPYAVEQSLKKLGSDFTTDRPLPLAEIYNQDDNFIKLEKEKQKMGF